MLYLVSASQIQPWKLLGVGIENTILSYPAMAWTRHTFVVLLLRYSYLELMVARVKGSLGGTVNGFNAREHFLFLVGVN